MKISYFLGVDVMKKIMLIFGLVVNWSTILAVGFDLNNPGYVVNGRGFDKKPGSNNAIEQQDQFLTTPIFIQGIDKKWKNTCTGTLIGKRYVLTAKNCLKIPQGGNFAPLVKVKFYNPISISSTECSPENEVPYYKIYKFYNDQLYFYGTQSSMILQNQITQNDPRYVVAAKCYEEIRAEDIQQIGSKMVILELEKSPNILANISEPYQKVTFSSIKKFAVINPNATEILGFGNYNIKIPFHEVLEWSRSYANLRSFSPGISNTEVTSYLPAHYDNSGNIQLGLGSTNNNFFAYTFESQSADIQDIGGILYYYQSPTQKTALGVIVDRGKLIYGENEEETITNIIEGFTSQEVDGLNAL